MKKIKVKPLSGREQAWIDRLQKVLDACPTKRIGFYTIGDAELSIYDRRFDDVIDDLNFDFCTGVAELDAELSNVRFPSLVHSTSG